MYSDVSLLVWLILSSSTTFTKRGFGRDNSILAGSKKVLHTVLLLAIVAGTSWVCLSVNSQFFVFVYVGLIAAALRVLIWCYVLWKVVQVIVH